MAKGKQKSLGKPKVKLRIGEIAKYHGVDTKTINKWCKEGKLEYSLTPGGQKIFDNPSQEQSSSKQTKKPSQGQNDKKLKEIPEETEGSEEPKVLGVRSKRRLGNKDFNEFVIKQSLANSLVGSGQDKNLLLHQLNLRVLEVSRASHKLGILVNLYLLDKLNEVNDLTQVNICKELFTKNSFMSQMITSSAKKPHAEIEAFKTKYSEIVNRYPIQRYEDDTNCIISLCSKYLTNFKTYLQVNFVPNQEKYLKEWCKENNVDSSLAWKIRNEINGWNHKEFEITPVIQAMINEHKAILGLNEEKFISKNWIQNNYAKAVIYFHYLSKYLGSREKKNITLAPLPSIKSCFMYIDRSVLFGIAKPFYQEKLNRKEFYANPNIFFKEFFDFDKLLTRKQKEKNFHFTGTIEIDGVAICFHYRRPKLPASQIEEIVYNPEVRTIGVDPGRNTLFCGVEKVENGFKKHMLSRKEFYSKTGMTTAKNLNKNWNKEIEDINQELSQTNKKSTTVPKFLEYVNTVFKHYWKLWNELTKKKRARSRFRVYCGRKKVYDTFFKGLLGDSPKRRVVLAYGDAGFASTSKYELSAPTTNLEKEARKWFKVVKVDEFRTSKIHYETLKVLAPVKIKNEQGEVRMLRGLHWLRDTKNSKFIDRDLNAAKNILRIFEWGKFIPPLFSRGTKKLDKPLAHLVTEKLRLVERPSVRPYLTFGGLEETGGTL